MTAVVRIRSDQVSIVIDLYYKIEMYGKPQRVARPAQMRLQILGLLEERLNFYQTCEAGVVCGLTSESVVVVK